MNCSKNTYENLAGIVESFANDQQFWSGEIKDQPVDSDWSRSLEILCFDWLDHNTSLMP